MNSIVIQATDARKGSKNKFTNKLVYIIIIENGSFWVF